MWSAYLKKMKWLTLTSTAPVWALFWSASSDIQVAINFLLPDLHTCSQSNRLRIESRLIPRTHWTVVEKRVQKSFMCFLFFCLNTGASRTIKVLIDPSAGSAQLSPEALFILTSCKLLYSPVSIETCLPVRKTAFKFQFMRTFHLRVPVWGDRLQCWVTKAARGRLWMKWPDLKQFSHGILPVSTLRFNSSLKSSALKMPPQQIMREGSFSKERCVVMFLGPNDTHSLSAWHIHTQKAFFLWACR